MDIHPDLGMLSWPPYVRQYTNGSADILFLCQTSILWSLMDQDLPLGGLFMNALLPFVIEFGWKQSLYCVLIHLRATRTNPPKNLM